MPLCIQAVSPVVFNSCLFNASRSFQMHSADCWQRHHLLGVALGSFHERITYLQGANTRSSTLRQTMMTSFLCMSWGPRNRERVSCPISGPQAVWLSPAVHHVINQSSSCEKTILSKPCFWIVRVRKNASMRTAAYMECSVYELKVPVKGRLTRSSWHEQWPSFGWDRQSLLFKCFAFCDWVICPLAFAANLSSLSHPWAPWAASPSHLTTILIPQSSLCHYIFNLGLPAPPSLLPEFLVFWHAKRSTISTIEDHCQVEGRREEGVILDSIPVCSHHSLGSSDWDISSRPLKNRKLKIVPVRCS